MTDLKASSAAFGSELPQMFRPIVAPRAPDAKSIHGIRVWEAGPIDGRLRMLAFNLGVFFRNLKGEEVTFSAKNDLCEVRFTGGVVSLHEHTDLTRHLSVTLGKGDLSFRIAFDENE